jgi:hypothetical protein
MFGTLIENDIQNILRNYFSKSNIVFRVLLPMWGLLLLTMSFTIGVGGAIALSSGSQQFDVFVIRKALLGFLISDLFRKFVFYNFSFRAYQFYLMLPISANTLFTYLLIKMTSGFMEILYLVAAFTFSLFFLNWSFQSMLFIFMLLLVLNINSLVIMTLKYIFSHAVYSSDYFLFILVLVSISGVLIFQFSSVKQSSEILISSLLLVVCWLISLAYTKKMMYKIMKD